MALRNKKSLLSLRSARWNEALRQLVHDCLPSGGTVVELGSFAGESTGILAGPARTVYAIDTWDQSYAEKILLGCRSKSLETYVERNCQVNMRLVEAEFDRRMRKHSNVKKIKADALVASKRFSDSSLEMVYIDTLHTYQHVRKLIELWCPKIVKGGILAGHDYDPKAWPGTCRAVDEAASGRISIYKDTSWAFRV